MGVAALPMATVELIMIIAPWTTDARAVATKTLLIPQPPTRGMIPLLRMIAGLLPNRLHHHAKTVAVERTLVSSTQKYILHRELNYRVSNFLLPQGSLVAIQMVLMEVVAHSTATADQVKTIARETKGVKVAATANHQAPQPLTIGACLPRSQHRSQPHCLETMVDVAQSSTILRAILKGSTEDVVPSGAIADRVQTPALDIKGVRAGAGLLTEAGRPIPLTRHHGTMAAVDGNLMVLSVIQTANMGAAVPNTAIAARRRKVRSIGPMFGFRYLIID